MNDQPAFFCSTKITDKGQIYIDGKPGARPLASEFMNQHAGDCTIYASLSNGCPTDGICTCGYARDKAQIGPTSTRDFYSKEKLLYIKSKRSSVPGDIVQKIIKCLDEISNKSQECGPSFEAQAFHVNNIANHALWIYREWQEKNL